MGNILIDEFIKLVSNIIKFVVTHVRLVVPFVIILIACIGALYFYAHFIILDITVKGVSAKEDIKVSIMSDASMSDIGAPGLHIIPRDTTLIAARSGNTIRTQVSFNSNLLTLFTTKTITLLQDKNATKVAYNSTLDNPCGAYDQTQDRLLQYSCTNPNSVVYYDAPKVGAWGIKSLASDLEFSGTSTRPYKGGLLGYYDYLKSLAVVNTQGSLSYLDLPGDYDAGKSTDDVKIDTDQLNPTNNNFVLVSQAGDIYLGTPTGTNQAVNYKKISAPKGYNSQKQQTVCSLSLNQVMCFRGSREYLADGPTSQDLKDVKQDILLIDFQTAKYTSYPIGGNVLTSLSTLVATSRGDIYGLNDRTLINFKKETNQFTAKNIAYNVDYVAANDTALYIQDGGVFSYNQTSSEAHQIFYSHNIIPSQILATNGNVFILGKSINSDESTYAWKLNQENDTTFGSRNIDLLPLYPESGAYGTIDIVDTTIHIDVPFNRSDTRQAIDLKKQNTIDYLQLVGIDATKLTVNTN